MIRDEFRTAILARLGLVSNGVEADSELSSALWRFMLQTRAPFEQTFFDWRGGLLSRGRAERGPSGDLYRSAAFAPVLAALPAYAPVPALNLDHAYFREPTPCTMLIDEVEAIWAPIAAHDDWSAFEAKLGAVRFMAQAYGAANAV